jgi:hypothetical protein
LGTGPQHDLGGSIDDYGKLFTHWRRLTMLPGGRGPPRAAPRWCNWNAPRCSGCRRDEPPITTRPRCSAAFQTKGSGLQYTAAAALLRPYPRQAIASPSAQWIEPRAVRRIVRTKRGQAKFGRVPFQAKAMFVLAEGDGQDPEIWHDLGELSECDG